LFLSLGSTALFLADVMILVGTPIIDWLLSPPDSLVQFGWGTTFWLSEKSHHIFSCTIKILSWLELLTIIKYVHCPKCGKNHVHLDLLTSNSCIFLK